MMGQVQKLVFTFFLIHSICYLLLGIEVVECGHHHHHSKKLFVFGDSYADTGNSRMDISRSWKVPYGITFPGKPSGRFSDGRVFTDFLARFLGLKTPVAYTFRKYGANHLTNGMNFAFGGTGVFDTPAPYPNITTQIDFFQHLLMDSIFTPSDLEHAIAHVSLVGNDYSAYLARNGSIKGLQTFTPQVVNQLMVDIQRIYNLGVKKISVTALQPLGCLPGVIQSPYQQCNDTFNKVVQFHNLLLQQAVSKFNNQTTHGHGSPIIIIDLYTSFFSIFQEKGTQSGNLRFENPLKPCCKGINPKYQCGDVDEKGNRLYTVCQDPKSYFFWDDAHPTQSGWEALSVVLQANLEELQH